MPPIRLKPASGPERTGPLRRCRAVRPLLRGTTAGIAALLAGTSLLAGVAGTAAHAAPAAPPASPPPPAVVWTRAAPPVSPGPLAYASAAFDADTSTLVLFGGVGADGTLSGATWVWDGSTWTAPVVKSSPPARELASMAFDPVLHQLILFGGQGSGGTLLDDTWAWNGASWYQLAVNGPSPSARESAALAYDGSGNLLLFGGTGAQEGAAPAPTTTTVPGLSPAAPTPETTAAAPQKEAATAAPATEAATAAPQQETATPTPVALGDTWRWTSSGWVPWTGTGPPARSGAALAYDRARATTVLFGGESTAASDPAAKPLGDTWIWSGSKWAQARPADAPAARFGAVADGFPTLGGVVLTSGQGAPGGLSDTWVWNGSTWVQAAAAGPASPRTGAAGAYDAARQEMVLFGGRGGGGGTLGDTALMKAAPPKTPPTTASTTTTVPKKPAASVPVHPPTTPAKRPTTSPAPTTAAPRPVIQPAPVSLGPPPAAPALDLSRSQAPPGASFLLSGRGFAPGSMVRLTFHSVPSLLGWARVDAGGSFSKVVSVPPRAPAGQHHIVADGTMAAGGAAQIEAAVTVVPADDPGTPLSTTLLLVGLALILPLGAYLGMALAGTWRRRRQTAA